jgi:hypothetical protein
MMAHEYDMSGYTPLKCGTRVMVRQMCFATGQWIDGEAAKVTRWTNRMGPRNRLPAGYEPIKFDRDGGVLMIHRDSFRVIDNRAA